MSDHNRLVEQTGVYYVGHLAGQLGYLFRQVKEHDKGVDAEIELTQSPGAVSPIIGVQIKARSDFRKTADNEISITVTENNIQYWKSFGRPVVLMAYSDSEPGVVFWTRVDNASSRTIRIRTVQKFDESTLPQFIRIISQYYADLSRTLPMECVSDILMEMGLQVGDVLLPVEKKLERAHKLVDERKFDEASSIYEALANIFEDVVSIWYNWGICLLESGEGEWALNIANEALDKSPEEWRLHHLLGACLASLERYQEAEESLITALKMAPFSPEAWNNLGLLHYWQGRNEEAFGEFCLAASYNPEDGFALFNLALCSTALEDYEKALGYYDACIRVCPNLYDAFNNKGLLFRHLWRIWGALDCYDKAIEIDPQNPAALCNSAYLLKDLGYNERAIQRYHMALELRPNDGRIHFDLGLLYCRKGDLQTAEYHFCNARDYLKLDMQQEMSEGHTGIVDIGYEVAYLVRIGLAKHSATVLSVDPAPQIALFNSVPGMRELLRHAHAINKSLSPEDPRETFSPTRKP